MADRRHKRDTDARRLPRATLATGALALVATGLAVTAGVASADLEQAPGGVDLTAAARHGAAEVPPADLARRTQISRAFLRVRDEAPTRLEKLLDPSAVAKAVAGAETKLWTTTVLNLWTTPAKDAVQRGELAAGKHVLVTGRAFGGRQEIVLDGVPRWVTAGYLSKDKPLAAAAGLSTSPCPDGSVENGLTSNAVLVYRSVCHAFPQITTYGGWDAHGEHASGRALDIMTSDPSLGSAIAEYLRAHAAELNLYDVIWAQRIWTPVRASEGWRYMSDRGSATANHYDHVHVSTY